MLTGILVPMPEEIELIISNMNIESVYESGRRNFYKGTLNGHECVVALSRIGKVASSVTAAIMIERFGIDRLIVAGVAGAINTKLKVGDIVVATEATQHDLDARPLFPQFEAPLLDKAIFPCHDSLVCSAVSCCEEFLQDDFQKYIDREYIDQFSLSSPAVYSGQICCGDQFIGSAQQLNKIQKELPDALCVEMEGGAVGQICYEFNIPYIVVRTISDSANDHAPIDFSKYIENVAKYYTLGVVSKILSKINE
ncbi:MAG: 5'-methylthioadenosine/adenosylhomocysteine nucleosidase [Sporocytophaga sp.]|uniref:5'-methylthioadenosine/adenosylhomocysteine nucleosidase n=1 Tax=Sporocytophaga sp. TaxID=2231183 RepID=UPI001B1483C6|nr:5'-methylthioadenosine/adenosylhomocysteine nucleosidase [Sporocytophaga sp.]MBO9699348.1 5'-methylthioadenosine/adenosylhomocysteine nucleosidase [Sporocytophaga sp.]